MRLLVTAALLLVLGSRATPPPPPAPEQIHLALAGDDPATGQPTGMRIGWYSALSTPQHLQFGAAPGKLTHTPASPIVTRSYIPGFGFHHACLLDARVLVSSAAAAAALPDTVYYRVGSSVSGQQGAAISWSDTFSFSTRPFSPDYTLRMSIFGDLGFESYAQRSKQHHVAADAPRPPLSNARTAPLDPISPEAEVAARSAAAAFAARRRHDHNNNNNRLGGPTTHWTATPSRSTIEALKNRGAIDGVWHLGDIGYADDAFLIDALHFHYEDVYSGYMNWFQNVSSVMPYMVSPGNHESECHSPACLLHETKYALPLSNFSAFNARWHMPSAESGGHPDSNMWYSFNYGPVHFVSLDTETDFPGAEESTTGDAHLPWLKAGGFGTPGEYLAWLEADLARADAARKNASGGRGRPWLIAGGHRPFLEIQGTVGKLFDKYGVDIYFAGHAHSYSRSAPAEAAAGGRVERHHAQDLYASPNATTWVVVGGAGCDEMKEGPQEGEDEHDDFGFDGALAPPGSGVVTSRRYATGVLTANRTALVWQLIDSETGTRLDEFTITK